MPASAAWSVVAEDSCVTPCGVYSWLESPAASAAWSVVTDGRLCTLRRIFMARVTRRENRRFVSHRVCHAAHSTPERATFLADCCQKEGLKEVLPTGCSRATECRDSLINSVVCRVINGPKTLVHFVRLLLFHGRNPCCCRCASKRRYSFSSL